MNVGMFVNFAEGLAHSRARQGPESREGGQRRPWPSKDGIVNDAQWHGGAGKRQETSRQAPLSSFCLSQSMLHCSSFPLNAGVRPRKESKALGEETEGAPRRRLGDDQRAGAELADFRAACGKPGDARRGSRQERDYKNLSRVTPKPAVEPSASFTSGSPLSRLCENSFLVGEGLA